MQVSRRIMPESAFLSMEDILFIHRQEIRISGGEPNIRDQEEIKIIFAIDVF
jgi:molybdenum cofactor biosynthesis enzyme MoaA